MLTVRDAGSIAAAERCERIPALAFQSFPLSRYSGGGQGWGVISPSAKTPTLALPRSTGRGEKSVNRREESYPQIQLDIFRLHEGQIPLATPRAFPYHPAL